MKRLLNLFRRTPPPPVPSQREAIASEEKKLLSLMVRQNCVTREIEALQKIKSELLDSLVPVPENTDDWNAEDRGTLLQMLRSDAGRKLLIALRQQQEALKDQACDDSEKRVDHARGKAVGYRQAIAALIILSAPPPPKEEVADTPDRSAGELRDQLSSN